MAKKKIDVWENTRKEWSGQGFLGYKNLPRFKGTIIITSSTPIEDNWAYRMFMDSQKKK